MASTPQSQYITSTDPSGALLPDINQVIYTNYNFPDYMPTYNQSYILRDFQSNATSDYFRPFIGDGSIEWPAPVAVDPSNNLYVGTVALSNFISRVDGQFISNVFPLFQDTPTGIAFDASGVCYVTTASSNISYETQSYIFPQVFSSKILKIDFAANTSAELTVSGVAFNKLEGIAIDSVGNIYVSDSITSTVFKITLTSYSDGTGEIYASQQAGLNQPFGLAFDILDNLYICNRANNQILLVNNTSKQISVAAATGLNNPTGVTYNKTNNCIYVANYGPNPPYGGTSSDYPTSVYVYQVVNEPKTNNITLYQLPIPLATNISLFAPDQTGREYYLSICTDLSGNVFTCGTTAKPQVFLIQGNGAFIKQITDNYSGTNSVGLFYGGFYADISNQLDGPISYNINPVVDTVLSSADTELFCISFTSPFKSDDRFIDYPSQPFPDPTTFVAGPIYLPYSDGMLWKINLNDSNLYPQVVYPTFVNKTRTEYTGISIDPVTDWTYIFKSRDSLVQALDPVSGKCYAVSFASSTFPYWGNIYSAKFNPADNSLWVATPQFVPVTAFFGPQFALTRIVFDNPKTATFSEYSINFTWPPAQSVSGENAFNGPSQICFNPTGTQLYFIMTYEDQTTNLQVNQLYRLTLSNGTPELILTQNSNTGAGQEVTGWNYQDGIVCNNNNTVYFFRTVWPTFARELCGVDSNNNFFTVTVGGDGNAFNGGNSGDGLGPSGITRFTSNGTGDTFYVVYSNIIGDTSDNEEATIVQYTFADESNAVSTALAPNTSPLIFNTLGMELTNNDSTLKLGNGSYAVNRASDLDNKEGCLSFTLATNTWANFSDSTDFEGTINPLKGPSSIVQDATSADHFYISNSNGNNIVRVSKGGVSEAVTVTDDGTNTSLVGIFNGPVGLCYNPAGQLYFINYSGNLNDTTGNVNYSYLRRLTFVTPTTANCTILGISLSQLDPGATTTFSNLNFNFSGMSYNNDYLYATDATSNQVLYFTDSAGVDASVTFVNGYLYSHDFDNDPTSGTDDGGRKVTDPAGIAFDSQTGQVFVSSTGSNEVVQISNNSRFNTIPVTFASSNVSLLTPQAITIDSAFNLYISNFGSSSAPIVKITHDFTFNDIYNSLVDGVSRPRQCVGYNIDKSIYVPDEHGYIPVIDSSNVTVKYANDSNPKNDLKSYNGTVAILETCPNLTIGPLIVCLPRYNPSISQAVPPEPYLLTVTKDQTNPDSAPPIVNIPTFLGDLTYSYEFGGAKFDDASDPTSKLYIPMATYAQPAGVMEVSFTSPTIATSKRMNILNLQLDTPATGNPELVALQSLAFNNDKTYMYIIGGGESAQLGLVPNIKLKRVLNYRTETTMVAETFYTFPQPTSSTGIGVRPYTSVVVDKYDYIYVLCRSRYYRLTPSGEVTLLLDTPETDPLSLLWNGTYMNYVSWENSLLVTLTRVNSIDRVYLSFLFNNMEGKVGPYKDTMYVYDVSANITQSETYDFSFNIYDKYIVIDPSNIPVGVATDTSIHFVMPNVLPAPTDVYTLACDGVTISEDFCNNCTYNKTKFEAGTFPTSVAYTTNTNFLYVSLQNNTISRINLLGQVDNNIIGNTAGLSGPTSLQVDASFNLFILNTTGGFISKLILTDDIFQLNNSFYTGITNGIDMVLDTFGGEYIYILSGISPSVILTRINAADGTGAIQVPLPFGTIFDPNGLTIDEFKPNKRYLYISDTQQTGINRIMKVDLLDGNYTTTTLISGLTNKPFKMANKNDGFIYVCNKTAGSLAKISIDAVWNNTNIDDWAVTNIDVPAGLCFDGSGNMFVANEGTGPRNSRISKIWIEFFEFQDVILNTADCPNTQIYNKTTGQYIPVDYQRTNSTKLAIQNTSNSTTFPIPFPYPIQNSGYTPVPAGPIPIPGSGSDESEKLWPWIKMVVTVASYDDPYSGTTRDVFYIDGLPCPSIDWGGSGDPNNYDMTTGISWYFDLSDPSLLGYDFKFYSYYGYGYSYGDRLQWGYEFTYYGTNGTEGAYAFISPDKYNSLYSGIQYSQILPPDTVDPSPPSMGPIWQDEDGGGVGEPVSLYDPRTNGTLVNYPFFNPLGSAYIPPGDYEYVVTQANGTNNFGTGLIYFLSGTGLTGNEASPLLLFSNNGTYSFDVSDSSNTNGELRFSTTAGGTFNGGTAYTTGVTRGGTPGTSGGYVQIKITDASPSQLFYYNSVTSKMGDGTPPSPVPTGDFNYIVQVATGTNAFGTGQKYYLSGPDITGIEMTPDISFATNGTYIFNLENTTNQGYTSLSFTQTPDGSEYEDGVTQVGTPGTFGSYTQLIVGDSTPRPLYYNNGFTSGMGNGAPTYIYYVNVSTGTNDFGSTGPKYYMLDPNGNYTISPSITWNPGATYEFLQNTASNTGYQISFSTVPNGTFNTVLGGTEYFTGITKTGFPGEDGAKTTVLYTSTTPNLYYYGTSTGMGDGTPLPEIQISVRVAPGTNYYGYGVFKFYLTVGAESEQLSPHIVYSAETVYIFDTSDSSNSGHQLLFSTFEEPFSSDGNYTTNVTQTGTPGTAGSKTTIYVTASTPNPLYYYCPFHSGMGDSILWPSDKTYTIQLTDTYGDGWNSQSYVTVSIDGTLVDFSGTTQLTLASGSGPQSSSFLVSATQIISVNFYYTGEYPDSAYLGEQNYYLVNESGVTVVTAEGGGSAMDADPPSDSTYTVPYP